jgi:ribonuclease HI
MLHIYTDGSTKGNGKKHSKGGYSIVIFDDNH